MITKTLELSCDHDTPDVCDATLEGQPGESRALPLIKEARAQGWVATNGWHYCPKHRADGDDK